jgi:RNA polymerase sigma-70 factor (ECF subfamily)
MSEDWSLVRQLNLGSKQALRRIFEKYKDDLYTITVSLVGDGHLAEDCLQDVFVHLAQAAGRIQVRTNLKGYLARAAVNRARDCLRRRSRQIGLPVEELNPEGPTLAPDHRLICDERAHAVLQAVARLPIEQREVFLLYTQGATSFREIARHQEISVRTAHSRYRYAVDKLRQLLHEEAPRR